MPNPDPARHAPERPPPGPGALAVTVLVLLAGGPLLAAVALATGDAGLTGLAGRVCRAAVALGPLLGALAALRPAT